MVLPEAIGHVTIEGNKDLYLGVKYVELIPLLIEALKELDSKIGDGSVVNDDYPVHANVTSNNLESHSEEVPVDSMCDEVEAEFQLLSKKIQAMEQRNKLLIQKINSYIGEHE